MFKQRHIWKAGEGGLPYYQAASAYKAAQKEADRTGVPVTVTRDGQPYQTFEPKEEN